MSRGPRLRTGRKVGRTIYLMTGDEPSDDDELIGLMDSREWATHVVLAVNASRLTLGPSRNRKS